MKNDEQVVLNLHPVAMRLIGERGNIEYERRVQEALAQLEPEHWQPHAAVDGRSVPLVDCDRIGFPTSFAGLGTLTLTAIDATCVFLKFSSSSRIGAASARNCWRYSALIGSASGSATVRGFLCTPFRRYS